jgi:hypothetical protein
MDGKEEETPKARPCPVIFQKIADIMQDMEAIGKDRKNVSQGYNFRGIDDVYNLVQPIMAKHRVFMRCEILADSHEERPSKGGGVLIYRILKMRYSFVADDGSFITTEVIGEGMDSGDKATNKAMSVAQKYAILQTFLVPTEDLKDPENDSPEPGARTTKPAGQVTKPVGQPAEPPKPITAAQLTEIADCVANYCTLTGKKPEEIAVSIVAKIKKQFNVEIKDPSVLTEAQAAWLIKSLWKAIEFEGAKKMKEIEEKMKAKPAAVPPAESPKAEAPKAEEEPPVGY